MEYRDSIFCRICEQRGLNKKAKGKYLVVHHPDASTWIHYDCETDHAFHQALAVYPPRILDCNCEAPD
jgi:hypothetical protein